MAIDQSKCVYWGLVAGLAVIVACGIWVSFFADRILAERGKLVEPRLGKKVSSIFQSAIRVLAMTISILALYLLINLLRIVQCALK